ncbi:MAG: hypothetical protein A2086_06940 [Spirochaetes bacterium GWD1_27_9]|nr:MAG: hypothetical protein A2Z98_00860 [Spirochaetes bacterium GWB1_27_13]OHD22449.1 MAG: hypothetical protein A2Y34_05325 [Spirochaetes bacterium GWC1_27_15]OHD29345.1 MAG: hypothetical protein A2086_06940 [Spirochaetes bacterium GWD1_27_9]
MDLLSLFKLKKQKKEGVLVFSFINCFFLDFYKNLSVDVLRFDVEEFSQLNDYKDSKSLNPKDFLPILKNVNKINDNIKIAVDLPLSVITGSDSDLLDFYRKSNANIFVLNLDYNINNISKRLLNLNIPIIVSIKNKFQNTKLETAYITEVYNKLIEVENYGSIMFIVENFQKNFVDELKKNISIPVVSTDNTLGADGFYGRFSNIFGIFENKLKYLNISELLKESIKDCFLSNKPKI